MAAVVTLSGFSCDAFELYDVIIGRYYALYVVSRVVKMYDVNIVVIFVYENAMNK